MVKDELAPLIRDLRMKAFNAVGLSYVLKLLPTGDLFPESFFYNVKIEQRLYGPCNAWKEFCDGLEERRNNDVISWLLVAADVTETIALLNFIKVELVDLYGDEFECRRIMDLYEDLLKDDAVIALRANKIVILGSESSDYPTQTKEIVYFHGNWPDHMATGKIFIRNECRELVSKIKQLLLGKSGSLVVYGTGGLGKTTTAVFVLRQLLADTLATAEFGCVKHVVWLNVCSLTMADPTFNEGDFANVIYELLTESKILPKNCNKTAGAMKAELESAAIMILFVMDDVFNIGVSRFLAKLGRFVRVLSLTRNRTKAFYENAWFQSEAYELPIMAHETIESMLVDFYQLNLKPGLQDPAKIKRLTAICLGLPLVATVINRTFANLESHSEIENNYWELVRSFEKLAFSGVAVDKLGNSSNAEMTVSALLAHSPEFATLLEDLLDAFVLFGPGETVSKDDLLIVWDVDDVGKVIQKCKPAVDASLLRLTADGGYILHDLLHNSVGQKLKLNLGIIRERELLSFLAKKYLGCSTRQLSRAILHNRPYLCRLMIDFSSSEKLALFCEHQNFELIRVLLDKINSGELWVKFPGSPLETSETMEFACRLAELCLNAKFVNVIKATEKLMLETLKMETRWYRNVLFGAIKFRCNSLIMALLGTVGPMCLQLVDADGNTPLIFAAMNGSEKNVIEALARMIDANIQNRRGETALWHCAKWTFAKDRAESICSSSANLQIDVGLKDKYFGNTSLHMAVQMNKFDFMVYLVEKLNADIALTNTANGATALDLALGVKMHAEIGAWLLDRPEAAMTEHWYLEAEKKATGSLLDCLLQKKEALLGNYKSHILSMGPAAMTPVTHAAALRNDLEALKRMNTEMANFKFLVRQADHSGLTSLTIACSNGNIEMVDFLLQFETSESLNSPDFVSDSPLIAASRNDHQVIVDLLLDHGANCDLQRSDGFAPMHAASLNGHFKVVKLLLYRGADIERQTSDGCTPLFIASHSGQSEIVKLLLNCGANIDMQNSVGWSALFAASQNGHLATVQVLLDRGATIDLAKCDGAMALHVASQNGYLDIVRLLLDRGALVDAQTNDGRGVLYTACYYGHLGIVELLLDRGANIHLQKSDGSAPLHVASQNGHLKIVQLLLSRGANRSLTTKDGLTAADFACKKGEYVALDYDA